MLLAWLAKPQVPSVNSCLLQSDVTDAEAGRLGLPDIAGTESDRGYSQAQAECCRPGQWARLNGYLGAAAAEDCLLTILFLLTM